MRARHRHFNPRHAGADLVLDARYINQSDNTDVSSWADRSANAHTIQQATAANQPKFRTNAMNGNPVVRFDGSDDFLNGGDILDLGTNSLINMVTAKRSSGSQGALSSKTSLRGLAGRWALFRAASSYQSLYDQTNSGITAVAAESSTSPRIYAQVIERATAVRLRFDGSQQSTTAIFGSDSSNHNTSDIYLVGAYGNSTGTGPAASFYFDGDIAQVVVLLTSSFSNSVLKRIEHASAYSFKISCN